MSGHLPDNGRNAVADPPSPDTRLPGAPPPPPPASPGLRATPGQPAGRMGAPGQPAGRMGAPGQPAGGTQAPAARREGAREVAERRAQQRQQPRSRPAPPADEVRTVPSAAHRLRRALHNDRALRQAVLLREILGPPVALRPPSDAPPGLR